MRTAPELTVALSETQRQSNRLDARRVHDAYDLLDVRLGVEFDRQARNGDGDLVRASKAAANDVSVALNVSFSAASTMLDAGEQL
ncbi:hypothetical protein [Rhodococcoides trifolii]|uniref:hypothetical protein n=1 Tax=Rhodococcoides trifolii TaxID=908250 RepID=UPI00166AD4FD|nr:hypothetical protein [Rhodococcus trifolii]